MNQQEEKKLPLLRKKLWEIDNSYRCAVIGTCLSRSEMQKLSRQRVFSISADNDDYELHTEFIAISRQPDLKGKSLHKYIEKKFRNATRKYFMVATDVEIESLWQKDFLEGHVRSGWWAIMTHPQISMDLVNRLYGQLHMLGHDITGGFHNKKVEVSKLKMKVTALEEVLSAERSAYLMEKKHFKEQLSSLTKETDRLKVLQLENQFFREKIASIHRDISCLKTTNVQELNRQLTGTRSRIDACNQDRNCESTGEVRRLREEQVSDRKNINQMKKQISQLEQQKADQLLETASLENILLQFMNQDKACQTCADQNTEECPGRNLCGRTVLYVGGLNKMVPHYRQMVENLGGCFVHHDGGKEVSRNVLPKMLITADAVLCPIDCVSHDACNCVKKMCKRNEKPFVLMRSASLSSLAKGLSSIVQQ